MSHVDDGQLNALLDGELSPADARAVESHVAACADCRRRLEEARAFLQEANSLLESLGEAGARTAPGAQAEQAAQAVPHVEVPERPSRQSVPLRPVGQLADLPFESGSVKPMPTAPPPAGPAAPAAKDPRKVMKTAREVAVDIDGRTALTPGIRPLGLTDENLAAPARRAQPPRRGWDLEKLAWAANIVLALGVGYLANEVRWMHGERQVATHAETVTVRVPAPAALGSARPQTSTPSSRGTGAARSHVATRLDKPSGARGPKPQPARPGAAANALALQRPSAADSFGARRAQVNAPVGAQPSRLADAAETRGAQGAGVAAAPSAAPSAPPALGFAVPRAAARAREEVAAVTPGFTRITMEEAVRTLSGSIRQIDGMTPIRIEAAGGRLVAGSDPSREVVRVNYTDQFARRFTLDQQLAEPRAGPAFSGIMPGDTLVTITAEGNSRVRWMDGKFWLSLTGPVPADEVKALVARVR